MTQQLQSIEELRDELSTSTIRFLLGVRAHLRDYPQLNRLTEGVESSDRAIAHGAAMMLSDFAGTPPPLGWFEISTLLDSYYFYTGCMMGTLYYVVDSVLNHYKRNELPFNDGGLSVQTDGLIPHIERQALKYEQKWEQAKRDKKIQMNIEMSRGTGTPGSEYELLSTWSNLHGTTGAV